MKYDLDGLGHYDTPFGHSEILDLENLGVLHTLVTRSPHEVFNMLREHLSQHNLNLVVISTKHIAVVPGPEGIT